MTLSENPTQLFVYGTLRRGAGQDSNHPLLGSARLVGEARVAGCLYEVGIYSAMSVSADGNYVKGEVYEIPPQEWPRFIEKLDDYEGCSEGDPEPHDYRREVVEAELASGKTTNAWAYVLNRPTTGLREISSGDWLAFQGE